MRKYIVALLGLAVLTGLGMLAARSPTESLRDGDVLGPSTWRLAEGLLPEEILAHYRTGDYVNPVMDLARGDYMSLAYPKTFQEASQANRGRYELGETGGIVEKSTGQQPPTVFGLPFPDISESDPEAAAKIVWNYFYGVWYRGNCHFLTELVMLGRAGVERRVTTDVLMLTYDGAPEARGLANPQNLLQQTLAHVVAPADLSGTLSLTWRYRDPGRPDSVWTYVPGVRKPRQVSPLNRSDGFLGSDISLDDGPFFDGKPEDFTFRVLEREDQLVLIDPYSLRGEAEIVTLEGGGWRIVWKDVPRIGADDPEWRGLPWAPVSAVLARRPTWIVEAVPKDPNYLHGRIVLRFDAETFHGSWSTKYDRAGTPVLSYQISAGAHYPVEGAAGERAYVSAGGVAVQTSENLAYERATVVVFPPRNATNPADYRVRLDPETFSLHALAQGR
jgi:hypothetical protein